jgi:hypothetical protein
MKHIRTHELYNTFQSTPAVDTCSGYNIRVWMLSALTLAVFGRCFVTNVLNFPGHVFGRRLFRIQLGYRLQWRRFFLNFLSHPPITPQLLPSWFFSIHLSHYYSTLCNYGTEIVVKFATKKECIMLFESPVFKMCFGVPWDPIWTELNVDIVLRPLC